MYVEKKILILGGTAIVSDIVAAARELDVYTIVTDWYDPEVSVAKKMADDYKMISISDISEIKKLIEEERIDGVITGFTDSYIEHYINICNITNKPCYLDKATLSLTTDKALFKETCDRYGLGVISGFLCSNIQDLKNVDFQNWKKAIVKPVDNSGSRGISVCKNYDELVKGYEYALSYSRQKTVIIERFMECDDISLSYTLRDGEIKLSSICDREIYVSNNGGSVTSRLVYPSKYIDRYINEINEKVITMFKESGFKNGVLFMQLFADEKGFYFYEMGYRLSGGRHYIFTKEMNDSSAVRMLIKYALTGDMGYEEYNRENPNFNKVCSQLSILCRSEEIGEISGVDKVKKMSEVIDCGQYYNVGDTVGKEGTTAQIVFRVHFVAEDVEKLEELTALIKKTLVVKNKNGKSMVI